jgi:hypothetical protein
MMLLFLEEEQVFTFFHDFKSVNIDLGLDVFSSIQSLSIGGEYVIRGGAFGDTTVRRVDYSISDGYCIVGDRVYKVLPNGDVDFDNQVHTVYNVVFASGDDEGFTKRFYVEVGGTFDLAEYLNDIYCDVEVLDWYEEERYHVADLRMDVWIAS